MKKSEFPMSLSDVINELNQLGIDIVVYRTVVEYDEHNKNVDDITLTLKCRAQAPKDFPEDPNGAYDRAMALLGK